MKSFKEYLDNKTSSLKTVHVTTEDGVHLEGSFLYNGNTVIAHTHGTASFYNNEAFEPPLREYCKENNYSFLTFNNRGAYIEGASKELFSDSPKDIQAWINWLHENGMHDIILSGHSLATEKIANFIKQNFNNISKILLFSPSDTIGNQQRYERKIGKTFIDEANKKSSDGNGEELLSDKKSHAGVLPMTANAYLDFYSEGKPLETALPFRNKILSKFQVECYSLVPTKDHYNITSTEEYIKNLEQAGAKVLECNTDHDFNDFNTLNALRSFKI